MADKPIVKTSGKGSAKPALAKSVEPHSIAPPKAPVTKAVASKVEASQAAPVPPFAAAPAAPAMVEPQPVVAAALPPVAPKVEVPTVVAPKAVEPMPAATAAPVAPVAAPAPKAAAPAAAAIVEKGKTMMNETMTKVEETAKTFTADATERTNAMFGDMNVKAKDAMAKGSKAVEEMVEFSKGNVEALVASARVAAKGAEEIAKYSAEYGRKSIEEANATAKQFAGVKSPTEFFQLQSEVAKKNLDAVVAESSKFAESYLKLLGEIAQPLQNRYAVAVEKVKTTVAA